MAKSKGPALSPIRWTVVRAEGAPQAKPDTAEGTVFVEGSPRSAIVRLSAPVRMARMTPLALALVGAFSASEGIRKDTGIISWIRWPDKVVIDDSVVAGSSVLKQTGSDEPKAMLTISINRLHSDGEGLTSLQDALGVEVDPKILVEKTLDSLSWMHFGWTNGMEDHVMKRIRSMTETIGTPVTARLGRKTVHGTAETIDPEGRLVIEVAGGRRMKLWNGDELIAQRGHSLSEG